MADETQEIEARLCAYIDGELDEAARAEIERHLASNPRHRQLIEEMSRVRRLLQSLPRESAPSEIEEVMHTHLERSVLLDDVSGAAAPLRMNRWPQFVAAAAIVLLAAGLGLIVWLVVRPPSASHRTAVNLPQGHLAVSPPAEVRMETAPSAPAAAPLAAGGATTQRKPATQQSSLMADGAGLAEAGLTARPAQQPPEAFALRTASGSGDGHRMSAAAKEEKGAEMGLWATTDDGPQTDLGLRAFISMQGLKAEVINLASLPQWAMCRPLRVVMVRGIDDEQMQSLRQLLDTSAQVMTTPFGQTAPPATTQALEGQTMDLAIVVDAQSGDMHASPGVEPAEPGMTGMEEAAPASQPTTMPDEEPQQMNMPQP